MPVQRDRRKVQATVSAAIRTAIHHPRDQSHHNPLARAWRALFAAWDEPRPGSPILGEAPERARPSDLTIPPDSEDGTPQCTDLPPAPLYFGYDAAEAALLRMLDQAVANALGLEERQSFRTESALPALDALSDRRAS